ncbi:MAG: septum formation initiator family protein [Candidatus Omnitrophota bacterium]|nr:septum formation initiator family protein [Candidatus Omnitrophota bacterium]
MRVKPLNLNYLSILRFFFFVGLFFIVAMIVYFPNYAKLKKLKEANQKLTLEVKSLSVEIKDLRSNIRKIGKDPFLYEKLARENLGVAKENEIVVDIKQ